MINLLANAIPHLQGILKNEMITIINKKVINFNGFAKEQESAINTFSHIQPLNPAEVVKLTSGTIDSPSMYKFYIIDNLASVLNSIEMVDCVIKWNNKAFKVFQKVDWALNGWVMVIGSEISLNDEVSENV